MFGHDGDLVSGGSDHLHVIPHLLPGYQSSLDVDVVDEDIDMVTVSCLVLISTLTFAEAHDMSGVQLHPSCSTSPSTPPWFL